MNTKPTLALILATITFIVVACSSAPNSSPILDRVPPERDYKLMPQLPVTGEQRSDNGADLVAHPLKQFHSACVSEDVQRQRLCVEAEILPGSIYTRDNDNAETEVYPVQQLHSACVSENRQRQEKCVE